MAKKRIAIGIGLGLFHNSLRKLVSVKRGAGVGVYFFLENAVLWLGLFRDRVRFRFRIRVRVRVRVSVNPNPNPKTAFFKKKDRPQSLVLMTHFAYRVIDFYLSVH